MKLQTGTQTSRAALQVPVSKVYVRSLFVSVNPVPTWQPVQKMLVLTALVALKQASALSLKVLSCSPKLSSLVTIAFAWSPVSPLRSILASALAASTFSLTMAPPAFYLSFLLLSMNFLTPSMNLPQLILFSSAIFLNPPFSLVASQQVPEVPHKVSHAPHPLLGLLALVKATLSTESAFLALSQTKNLFVSVQSGVTCDRTVAESRSKQNTPAVFIYDYKSENPEIKCNFSV